MTASFEMNRRALLERALLLIGATGIPGLTVEAFAQAAAPGKRTLDPAAFALLSAVADTIMPATDTPGAVAAGVPEKLDFMLANWASPQRKTELVGALSAIDKLAMTQSKKGFATLDPAQRKALLIEHDKAALVNVPRKEKLSGIAAMLAGPSVVDPGYSKLKELIVNLYYNSEIAMTQELIYEHVPGGWTPSIKTTPETRPYAGSGPF